MWQTPLAGIVPPLMGIQAAFPHSFHLKKPFARTVKHLLFDLTSTSQTSDSMDHWEESAETPPISPILENSVRMNSPVRLLHKSNISIGLSEHWLNSSSPQSSSSAGNLKPIKLKSARLVSAALQAIRNLWTSCFIQCGAIVPWTCPAPVMELKLSEATAKVTAFPCYRWAAEWSLI